MKELKLENILKASKVLTEIIRKIGKNKWGVYSHQTGRCFGRYNSLKKAKHRLAQMHAFSGK